MSVCVSACVSCLFPALIPLLSLPACLPVIFRGGGRSRSSAPSRPAPRAAPRAPPPRAGKLSSLLHCTALYCTLALYSPVYVCMYVSSPPSRPRPSPASSSPCSAAAAPGRRHDGRPRRHHHAGYGLRNWLSHRSQSSRRRCRSFVGWL